MDQVDAALANNTASVEVMPQGADLVLTKRGPGFVDRGETLIYTLTVRNNGPSEATQVTVTDPPPAELTFESAEAPCTAGFPCLIGSLGLRQEIAVVTRYTVPTTYMGPDPILNTASVTSAVTDPVPSNNSVSSSTAVARAPEADLVVSLRGPPSAAAGSTATYTIAVTNQGSDDALPAVTLTYTLPRGLTLVSATGPCGTGFPCNLGTLNAGGTVTMQVTLAIPAEYAGPDPIPNQVSVSSPTTDPDLDNNTASVRTPLGANPADLQLTKTGPAQVAPGSNAIYTLAVTNRGPARATGVVLEDPTPTGLTFVSATAPCQAGFPCALGTMDASISTTILVTFTIPASYAGPPVVVNTAQVRGHEPDGNNANNRSTVSTGVDNVVADVSITETGPASVEPGDAVTYTMVLSNAGPGTATDVELTSTVPAGLTVVSTSAPCTTGLPCRLGDLVPGASITVSITFLVPADYAGPSLFAHPVRVETAAVDPLPANNTATVRTTVVTPTADLAVTKTAEPPLVQVGGSLLYTLTVTNHGPAAAAEVTLQDTLPAAVTVPTTTPGAPTCTVAGPTVTCTLGPLAPGANTLVTLRGTVTAARGLTNTASVQAREEDPDTSNNTATVSTIGNTPPVAIDDVTTTTVNTPVTLDVLGNDSDADDDALQVERVTQPAGGRVVIHAGGTLTYTPRAGFLGVDTFTYTIRDGRGGTATATVTVTVANVLAPPSGRKTVHAVGFPALEWRQVWINAGNEVATLVRVTDEIPPDTTFVAGSLTCEAQGNSTVRQCVFAPGARQIIYAGEIAPDPGAASETEAMHAVVITFRSQVVPGITEVANQAQAQWDANGNGTLADELSAGQAPALSDDPATPEQDDPTVFRTVPVACLVLSRFDESLRGPEIPGGPEHPNDPEGSDDPVDEAEAREVPQEDAPDLTSPRNPFTVRTPHEGAFVAGTQVAVALLQVPRRGPAVSAVRQVVVVNHEPDVPPDIVEDSREKTQRLAAQLAQVVVTAGEVLVEFPAEALAVEDTLQVDVVEAGEALRAVPGLAARPVVAVALASGRTTFAHPVTLRLPYPDGDQDGVVDGTDPALDETTLTLWFFDVARQTWRQVPEAVVFPQANVLVVHTTQSGIFGVFHATDGRVGSVGAGNGGVEPFLTGAPVPLPPRDPVGGWRIIGATTTFPFLVPWNTAALADGFYDLRAICAEDLVAAARVAARLSGGPGGESRGDDDDGGRCFIATAAFGSPLASQVQVLRDFRDVYLLTHAPGRRMAALYYTVSPFLAAYIQDHAVLRALVRAGLTPVVWGVDALMHAIRERHLERPQAR